MLNRAPYNTEVPQFVPSRDAPINSYIIRKYPCQEHLAGKTNEFRTLTWKIQQPDASMVWQSVKVVMPMEITVSNKKSDIQSMAVDNSGPCCNVALSQSPMNAFRQTSLSINGRIFSEDNQYRDVLDACYRGVGAQAYGDNHSLKPIVHRNLHSNFRNELIDVVAYNDGAGELRPVMYNGHAAFAEVDEVEARTTSSAFNLLEHNGPFIERARIFQDQLSFDGKTWSGDISHLLELGPFQARARKGNTAVPYIQDFHLRLNFHTNPSKFDAQNPGEYVVDHEREMAPKLLEFATLANFLHKNETVSNFDGWPAGYAFKYTAQPYLEVVYTKHESPMRDSYNLRCFEHLYEKSNRFQLLAPDKSFVSPTSLQRVTSRLLSLPTKMYVWAEVSDEYKYAFAMGGVRRSCLLKNLHLRVNQRPDVMFNPSQEECYEMFRRHTNSSLEYGSWLKSPIYCFDMVDVGQPDMFSNDARIAWFEWDTEVSLTELQMIEQKNLKHENYLEATGYDRGSAEQPDMSKLDGFISASPLFCWIDALRQPKIRNTDTDLLLTLGYKRDGLGSNSNRHIAVTDAPKMKHQIVVPNYNIRTGFMSSDFTIDAVTNYTQSLDGMVWAQVYTEDVAQGNHSKGDIMGNTFWYVPESYRWVADDPSAQTMNNPTGLSNWNAHIKVTHPDQMRIITGSLKDNGNLTDQDGKPFGNPIAGSAKMSPGPFAYTIDGNGIDNSTLYMEPSLQAEYVRLHPSATAPGKITTVEYKLGSHLAWLCFSPPFQWPTDSTGNAHWTHMFIHTETRGAMDALGCPDNWVAQNAGSATHWHWGVERVNVATTGKWGANEPETFDKITLRDVGKPYGAQQDVIVQDEEVVAQGKLTEDYQLKVLYEYGNCQYNFSRNGAPTRVLPNVVPVGPSPGLPSL